MPDRTITSINVRDKGALTTSFVMETESIFADAGNTPDANQDFTTTGGNADKEWMARKFKSPSSEWVSTISLTLAGTGTPAGTLEAYIFTDDGETISMPSAQLSGSEASDLVTCSDISTDVAGETVTFRWTRGSPWIKKGVIYWIVIKSTGYTYSNGNTEVRWRTDANGAVARSECAKYDANATTTWTRLGADIGADVAVNAAQMMSIGDKNQVVLNTDFTQGDSSGSRIMIEFSEDRVLWVQEPYSTNFGDVTIHRPHEHEVQEDIPLPIAFPVASSYMRLSLRALTSATNAELGIDAVLAWV